MYFNLNSYKSEKSFCNIRKIPLKWWANDESKGSVGKLPTDIRFGVFHDWQSVHWTSLIWVTITGQLSISISTHNSHLRLLRHIVLTSASRTQTQSDDNTIQ